MQVAFIFNIDAFPSAIIFHHLWGPSERGSRLLLLPPLLLSALVSNAQSTWHLSEQTCPVASSVLTSAAHAITTATTRWAKQTKSHSNSHSLVFVFSSIPAILTTQKWATKNRLKQRQKWKRANYRQRDCQSWNTPIKVDSVTGNARQSYGCPVFSPSFFI